MNVYFQREVEENVRYAAGGVDQGGREGPEASRKVGSTLKLP